jgi:hypothetical protein
MPKLNTTVDNLELRSNKVFGDLPSVDWTDDQYPSAKTLYNVYNVVATYAPSVGDVVITSTNTSPSTKFGGEWTLIDKAFASKSFTKVTWTAQNNTDSSGSTMVLDGHTIQVRLSLITKVAIATTAVLGTISFSDYTLSSLPHTLYGSTQATISSTDYVIDYKVESNGKVSVLRTKKADGTIASLPIGTSFYIDFSLSSAYTNIKDANCDKFYWKRTA